MITDGWGRCEEGALLGGNFFWGEGNGAKVGCGRGGNQGVNAVQGGQTVGAGCPVLVDRVCGLSGAGCKLRGGNRSVCVAGQVCIRQFTGNSFSTEGSDDGSVFDVA